MRGLFKGLATTFSTAVRGPVTVEYPDEKHVLPKRQRSFPVLLWDFDHDEPVCTGCNVCIRNCPVDCMSATMKDNPKYAQGTSDRRKIVEKFWIDYARCMRCDICVEACSFEAIVMDNTWDGHQHSVFDRRDLHMDISDLTEASRSGRLQLLWRPDDSIAENVAGLGDEVTATFTVSTPEARRRMLERIEQGLPAAIQEREPEKPKETAAGAGAAAGLGDVEMLSPRKARAKRMRAQREAKEFQERGEPVPQEVQATIDLYSTMEQGIMPGAAPGASGAAPGEVLTGTNSDGTMRFPPDVGTGPKGDPNSLAKVKARRTRAERKAKELIEAGEEIPEDIATTLYDLGSDLAPGGGIWTTLAGATGAGGAVEVLTGTNPDGSMRFPPDVGTGPKGDPNSPAKVKARRMRAERQAKELVDAGEEIPEDMAKTLYDLGSDMAPGRTIWEELAEVVGGAGGGVAAAPSAGGWVPPPGIGTGAKGDPNSFAKVRARRMRAERQAREALEAGESIPEDVLNTINELGGTVPEASD